MPVVNVTKQVSAGKRSSPAPKLKTMKDLKKLPTNPKPQVPDLLKPLGGGTGEADPQVSTRNSPKGVKQRAGIKNPFSAL